MEPFRPLTCFYYAVSGDVRINPLHISVYMALLQQWNSNGANPILVFRTEIMKQAKINVWDTYIKLRNNLDEYGYVRYYPSANGHKSSKVFLVNSEKKRQLWKT